MNVSLPPEQERFVRELIAGGAYQTASEVVRHGLRLLEEAQHQRFLEKSLYSGLTDDENERVPRALTDRVRDAVRQAIEEGRRSGELGGWMSSAEVKDGVRSRRAARRRTSDS